MAGSSSPPLLDAGELASGLASLAEGWRVAGIAIERRFVWPSFREAFGFMTAVAAKAEAMDHHPDWSNLYNRVDVRLTTHSAGGVTALDLELARFMDDQVPG